jgi:ribosomal protein L11 methyltransferase
VELPNGVELAVYLDEAELPRMREAFPAARVELFADGWEDEWRRFHTGTTVGPLWIGPPWERPPPDRVAVVVDPGRAFGTGSHATTRLCVELLRRLVPASLLDVGCGSGVLSIAAAKLGYAPVWSIDIEDAAVEAARRNAATNGVEITARRADALTEPLPRTEVVVANIALEPLQALGRRLTCRYAITSGYLTSDFLRLPRFRQIERLERDGWAADLFERS